MSSNCKKIRSIIVVFLFIFLIYFGYFTCSLDNDNNKMFVDKYIRTYSVKIISKSSYYILIPVVIEENGLPPLMDNIRIVEGKGLISIQEDKFGYCLGIMASGNISIESKYEYHSRMSYDREYIPIPPNSIMPNKITLSMSNIWEFSEGSLKEEDMFYYNTSRKFKFANGGFAIKKFYFLGMFYGVSSRRSYSYIKGVLIEDEPIQIKFRLSEEWPIGLHFWDGDWWVTNGWNQYYVGDNFLPMM